MGWLLAQNYIIFRISEIFQKNSSLSKQKNLLRKLNDIIEMFRNIQILEMKSSKLVNYSGEMCWS